MVVLVFHFAYNFLLPNLFRIQLPASQFCFTYSLEISIEWCHRHYISSIFTFISFNISSNCNSLKIAFTLTRKLNSFISIFQVNMITISFIYICSLLQVSITFFCSIFRSRPSESDKFSLSFSIYSWFFWL